MLVQAFRDAGALLAQAGAFLLAREVQHSHLLSVLSRLEREAPGGLPYLALVREAMEPALVAAQPEPGKLFVSTGSAPAVDALAADLDARGARPRDAVGECSVVERLGLHFGPGHRVFELGLLELGDLRAPAGVPGRMRPAHAWDFDLLCQWQVRFQVECRLPDPLDNVPAEVRRRLDEGRLAIWEHDGVPRCFAGFGRVGDRAARVAPVYTPPALRNRGYARALVAALCAQLRDRGRSSICLFTDLANGASNRAYEAIGFRRVGEHLHLRFGASGADGDGR